jgi:hypothetical protein
VGREGKEEEEKKKKKRRRRNGLYKHCSMNFKQKERFIFHH